MYKFLSDSDSNIRLKSALKWQKIGSVGKLGDIVSFHQLKRWKRRCITVVAGLHDWQVSDHSWRQLCWFELKWPSQQILEVTTKKLWLFLKPSGDLSRNPDTWRPKTPLRHFMENKTMKQASSAKNNKQAFHCGTTVNSIVRRFHEIWILSEVEGWRSSLACQSERLSQSRVSVSSWAKLAFCDVTQV